MNQNNIADLEAFRKTIEEADGDLLRGLTHETIQMLMGALADGLCRVAWEHATV